MPHPFVIIFGKAVRRIARIRGGGSALPGLFVEKISPDFVAKTLSQLPQGVVVVSGTNGKTTTTKMVVSLLESQGLRVFTNRTGSNFVRGIAAALLADISVRGKLSADIAVLELDEAHAVRFVDVVKPRYSLLLNVMRDQLDRFGEIDTTARLLEKVADATTEAVVLNREDNRLREIGEKHAKRAVYFGLDASLQAHFPNDDELHTVKTTKTTSLPDANTLLTKLSGTKATFSLNGKTHSTPLKVRGIYNVFNAAGALALVRTIVPAATESSLLTALAEVKPAFGRGESFTVAGHPLELVLVKNPAGFRLSLASFNDTTFHTMIAVNDNYADGRDMSWLWDVDFSSLKQVTITSGIRAYDIALRLQYNDVPVHSVDTDLASALRHFIEAHPDAPKRIYCTYTAMLSLRKELAKITEVEVIA